MDHLISQFIDNELDLDEKIVFTKRVNAEDAFADETVDLLQMEKTLRADPIDEMPPIRSLPKPRTRNRLLIYGMPAIAAVFTAILAFSFIFEPTPEIKTPKSRPYRFVIYQPDAQQAEIVGSFTDWQEVPLQRHQDSGYWEVTLRLPTGEHRFWYVLNGKTRMTDPTISENEKDDFGGENSILSLEAI